MARAGGVRNPRAFQSRRSSPYTVILTGLLTFSMFLLMLLALGIFSLPINSDNAAKSEGAHARHVWSVKETDGMGTRGKQWTEILSWEPRAFVYHNVLGPVIIRWGERGGTAVHKQWYAVLGNHGYRGNALAQLDLYLHKIDRRWLCLRSFVVDTEAAQFFFLDTTPFVKKCWTHPKKIQYDWRGVAPRKKYISNLLKDLDSALAAKWKIVVGHHTIRSVNEHGVTVELVDKLLPMLETYGVDLYLNGHDHFLEHISSTDSPLQISLQSASVYNDWQGVKGMARHLQPHK